MRWEGIGTRADALRMPMTGVSDAGFLVPGALHMPDIVKIYSQSFTNKSINTFIM
ncbi:hypothetical protein ACFPOH_09035 [Ureibacillus suwonensis]|uniref:Uncharacterized protein n=1 Tax=Ureibacillus suwonensis TaxID=313007 RepID=A0ABW0RBI6_9BACL